MTQLTIQQAFDLALQHHHAGRLAEAEQICRQIIDQQPQRADAVHLLGLIAHQVGRNDAAADLIRRATVLRPDHAESHYNLGIILKELGKLDEAEAALRRAIALRPDFPAAHSNLGNAVRDQGRLDEAIPCYRQAIALKPDYAEGHGNLGIALREIGKLDEAIAAYRQAIAINPNYVDAHWNLSLILLSKGDFAEGWEEFEWRLRLRSRNLDRNFPQPYWNGQNLPGQTLLIYTEGGLGDALNFIRLLPLLRGRADKLIVECQPELLKIFQAVPSVDQWIARGEALPPFECRISLQSLPRLLKIRLNNIPNSVPYLKPPAQAVEQWKTRIPRDGIKNIGLRWAGSPGDVRHRSRTLDLFAPLAQIPGVRFFSLQKGPEGTQSPPRGMELIDHTRGLSDFADTAALIENLDLVISVDTSVAHLAGALAKPVWVLVPLHSDFRWLLDRDDSPWYPTMRLFRQQTRGEWETVIARLAGELSHWAESRA